MSKETAPDGKPEESGKGETRSRSGKRLATGLAFGIGSAAIVAALLFANRTRKNDDE